MCQYRANRPIRPNLHRHTQLQGHLECRPAFFLTYDSRAIRQRISNRGRARRRGPSWCGRKHCTAEEHKSKRALAECLSHR